jgi:ribosomal protein S18 acetylase RimI-like enzyme
VAPKAGSEIRSKIHAGLADVGHVPLIKLIAEHNREHLGFINSGELTRAAKHGRLLIAAIGSEVIGFLNFWFRRDSAVTIYAICVASKYRRRGVGRTLLDELDRLAHGAGMNVVRLKCPIGEGANLFYARTGFMWTGVTDGKRRQLNVWEKSI